MPVDLLRPFNSAFIPMAVIAPMMTGDWNTTCDQSGMNWKKSGFTIVIIAMAALGPTTMKLFMV